MPVISMIGAFGFTVQKTVKVPQLQCLLMFAVQFIDGCGRLRDQAATSWGFATIFYMAVMAAMNMAVWFWVEGLFRRY